MEAFGISGAKPALVQREKDWFVLASCWFPTSWQEAAPGNGISPAALTPQTTGIKALAQGGQCRASASDTAPLGKRVPALGNQQNSLGFQEVWSWHRADPLHPEGW